MKEQKKNSKQRFDDNKRNTGLVLLVIASAAVSCLVGLLINGLIMRGVL